MGKSRFEGMEIAIREQAKITTGGADSKVEIETLEAELATIDKEIAQKIEMVKSTPINKELLRKQAEIDLDCRLKENDRTCRTLIMKAEQSIHQAELNADNEYKQAQLDINTSKANFKNLSENAVEQKEKADLDAKQEFEKVVSSVDNTEKTLTLQIEKEKTIGEKRKKEIDIKLRSLRARDSINEEQKKCWQQFYTDTVEISKQPTIQ